MPFTVFDVRITHVETRAERTCGLAKEFVAYVLRVKHGNRSWLLEKRYSDFVAFEKQLKLKFWYMAIPKLPPKKFFFNYDQDFLETRRLELQRFMQDLLKTACWSQSDVMWDFLTDDKSIVGVPADAGDEEEEVGSVFK
eukprot:CAMPEP_0117055106 /NCGR_PEP_ID=MMETSP0472-20121206/38195_1 /TAXON_ID=693140 ORGANISM="Tiarina fusus, Strain LIS" /NCGR_SAMPLE_ID=MMETSP0472 /ASSEMBLY_ACC=CAM_ASM_000603 /LENGTH=138 /DNA_ID=CAMNT_0004770961 /DNA_START=9 /DNA_END=422 /DNA_ORIENTATION=-